MLRGRTDRLSVRASLPCGPRKGSQSQSDVMLVSLNARSKKAWLFEKYSEIISLWEWSREARCAPLSCMTKEENEISFPMRGAMLQRHTSMDSHVN
jgi:hypothetical protein